MGKSKSGVTWKRGNPAQLELRVRRLGENFKAEALEALERSVEEGALQLQDNLEAAVTRTGQERAARGGFPGRHDTGNMVGSVSHEVRNPRSRRVMGVFGWWGSNFEQYFKDQDLDAPSPARSLYPAYIKAREAFTKRMSELVRGRSWRV